MTGANIVVVPCKTCGATGFDGDRIEWLEAEMARLEKQLADINPAIKCRSGCAVVKELDAT